MIQHRFFIASVIGIAAAGPHRSMMPTREWVPPTTSPACSAAGGEPRRLELADGRIVSLDVRSLARSGEWVLATGRYGYVFPPDARSRTSPTLVDSVIGVLVDGRGGLSLVSNPLAPTRVSHPRVAAAPNGEFHVLFSTGLDTVGGTPTPTDTNTLWYATFSHRGWSQPSVVTRLSGAYLIAEVASALLEHEGELGFAFPFVDDRSDTTDGGVILLRGRRGRWSFDTLRTYRMPHAVRAVHEAGRSAIVTTLVMPDRSRDNFADRLYIARFDRSWSSPRQVAGDGLRSVTVPALAPTSTGLAVSWVDWRPMQPATSRLHWLHFDPQLQATVAQRVDSGDATYPFEMVVVDERHPLWLYHGRPFGESVTLAMSVDSALHRPRPLVAPFRNPIASTLALSQNRFLVFTQKPAMTESEPMAASYMTVLEIRCPTSVRR